MNFKFAKTSSLQLESESHSLSTVRWRNRGFRFSREFISWHFNENDEIFTKVRLLVSRLAAIAGFDIQMLSRFG